jgi:fido (protein-threonine AMPylation protein)
LVGNANYWLETNAFPFEEIAVRVHHKLVWIHPFPNGNGRHARLIADLLMHYEKRPSLTWGGASIDVEGVTRRQYLLALREADKGNFEPLIEFAKQR